MEKDRGRWSSWKRHTAFKSNKNTADHYMNIKETQAMKHRSFDRKRQRKESHIYKNIIYLNK